MDCPLSSPSWPRYTPIGRGSRGQLCLPCGALAATRIDLASMQLASVATCATACRSRSVTTRYARAAGSLGAQDRQTSGGWARSNKARHANRPWQSRPAVPAMRCSGSCYKANGAAGRIAAALVLMRATRLSPGRTQAAAEPTARPTAAAVSTDSNENGRICVGGLGPDAGSVCRRPERQRPDARHQSRTPRAPDAVRSQ